MLPVVGPGVNAYYDWQQGHYGRAAFNAAMAVWDLLPPKSLATVPFAAAKRELAQQAGKAALSQADNLAAHLSRHVVDDAFRGTARSIAAGYLDDLVGGAGRGVAANRIGTGFSGHCGFELGNHPLQPVRNTPTTINGRLFSGHALDQMQNRGIPPSVVENAIDNGVPFAGNRPGTQGFYDAVNRVRVIINSETGNVITVIHEGG